MSVRVLIVDDSPTMRGLITAALRRDPEIEVLGSAADPLEAREAIKRLNPDVITLDVEMPNMNGLEFLEKIMRLRPMPVVMVSTLTQAGAEFESGQGDLGAGLGQCRDHDDGHRPQAHDLLEELQAVHVRHLDVEGDDIGVQPLDGFARLQRIGGRADHLDFGIAAQGGRDQAPHGGRVVDDEDADAHDANR